MGRNGNIILFLIGLLLLTGAHSQTVWSEVKLDKSSVYLGEPVEVKISVYTSTWFTSGVDLGNIKVNGAFTVYFRSVSTSFQKNGQNYAGVELIYHIFPYSEKDIIFPSIDITVETPPEGDYKGKKRVVKSEEKQIRVEPIPGGFDQWQWLVTTGLTMSDNWQGNLKNVKVGDVLVRQISRTAEGTVSELIPPIAWDSIAGVSLYQARSNVSNTKSKTAISAVRTETMRYLFEKEGELKIPEMVFTWYNPNQKQLYKRTLKEITIKIKPNPDLGVMASIRDSLSVEQAAVLKEEVEEKKPFTAWGYTPEQLAGFAMAISVILYVLILLTKRMIRVIKRKYENYQNSEAYYFDLFKKMARQNRSAQALNALYRWVDELNLAEPSLSFFAKTYGNKELSNELLSIELEVVSHQSKMKFHIIQWRKARKNYVKGLKNTYSEAVRPWINPVACILK
jgi:hypothetical protein